MQTILSNTERSYMRDPAAFASRMKARAELLWIEDYTVEETSEDGLFAVNTPTGDRYLVNIVREDCTCPYAVKNEVPQVKCKHLQGLAELVEEQLSYYHRMGSAADANGRRERASKLYWCPFHALLTHWNRAKELVADTQEAEACEMDLATYRAFKADGERQEVEEELAAAGYIFLSEAERAEEYRRDDEIRNFVDLKD